MVKLEGEQGAGSNFPSFTPRLSPNLSSNNYGENHGFFRNSLDFTKIMQGTFPTLGPSPSPLMATLIPKSRIRCLQLPLTDYLFDFETAALPGKEGVARDVA